MKITKSDLANWTLIIMGGCLTIFLALFILGSYTLLWVSGSWPLIIFIHAAILLIWALFNAEIDL